MMATILRFLLYTLLLAVGVFMCMAMPHLDYAPHLMWFFSTFLVGGALALVVKNCGRGQLLLAIPIAVLSANAVAVQIWPPHIQRNIFWAFNPIAKRDAHYQLLRSVLLPVAAQPLLIPRSTLPSGDHDSRLLSVAAGLEVSVFAGGLDRPHALAINRQGVLFVSLPELGQVVALPDRDRDGVADESQLFAGGLDRPSGLVFHDGMLYVAMADQVVRFAEQGSAAAELFCDELPASDQHWAHALVVGGDRHLYLSVGAGVEHDDWRCATVLRLGAGGQVQAFASGLHDCQGLAVHPRSGSIWATDNNPDALGFDVHPDELNVLQAGADYGWPFCYGYRQLDDTLGSEEICRTTQPALMQLPADSLPRGLAFGHHLDGAAHFKSMLYVVLQGSADGRWQQGFRLLGVPLAADGRILGWGIDLVSGWGNEGQPWGQPTDCIVGGDGCLYLCDTQAGVIYRIKFR